MIKLSKTLFCCVLLTSLLITQSFAQNGLHFWGALDQKHGSSSDSPPVSYSACWGYVHPNGREYALMTTYTGTAFIDITKQDSIREIAHITGPSSIWRELRTYKDRAYVVSEGGGGVQIFNLKNLPASVNLIRSFTYTGVGGNITRSHTIEIFDGYMYLNGCANWSPGGTLIFSLAKPDTPQYVGQYQPDYIHDCYVRNDTLFGASIYSGGGLNIANLANKAAPVHIAKISYSGSGTHNAWTTSDGRYAITTDEIGSTPKTLKFWSLAGLPTPPSSPVATFTHSPADIEHNVFVRGKYAYVAWYTAGMAVVDVRNPLSPTTAGYYDSSSEPAGGYDGVWACYPYFWSGKVMMGDMQNGLYIFTFDSLKARTPVSLISPAHQTSICSNNPITFRWTRVADPNADPHKYKLVLKGPSIDSTFKLSTDTTYVFSNTASLANGTYKWYILTKDEANEIATVDSFTFNKATKALAVSSPNGGETMKVGSSVAITWSETCVNNLELSYSTDNGASWNLIVPVLPGFPNSYQWTVPSTTTTQALIRLRDNADTTFADVSNAVFTIFQSSAVNVLVPNGGEQWRDSTVHNISWTSQVISNVAIDVSYNGGSTWTTLVADTPAVAGSFAWMVPNNPTTNALIRIRSSNDSTIVDQSDLPFTIFHSNLITTLDVGAAWNLVSFPGIPESSLVVRNFPAATSGAYYYDGGYSGSDTIKHGFGFWIKYGSPQTLNAYGTPTSRETVNVSQRWNIIGSLSAKTAISSLEALPVSNTLSGFFGYADSTGYYVADSIAPGGGYWVKASEAGQVILVSTPSISPVSRVVHSNFSSLTALTFVDAANRHQTLYLGTDAVLAANLDSYELPPPPPEGVFDVRFSSQRFVGRLNSPSERLEIELRSVQYPLTISLDPRSNMSYRIVEENRGESARPYALTPTQNIVLSTAPSGPLVLESLMASQAPTSFALHQNYPNPFNPTTIIGYDVPTESFVSLKVLNLLGQDIATLVNEVQQAGSRSIAFDASGLPSGVYYCKLSAGGFVLVKSMVVMR